MATVSNQIQSASKAISENIKSLRDQRALLSQNILQQLRNLIEGVAVLIYRGSPDVEFTYPEITMALKFIGARGNFKFLDKFHQLIQKSASHYSLDGDASERLMLKYYEYLYRIRGLLKDDYRIAILANLEAFPIDIDPSLREYHEKIAAIIEHHNTFSNANNFRDRYYIHKTRPFFVGGSIYYEVTFYRAINKVNKHDRIIAFTTIDMTDKYAAYLSIQRDSIEVLGHWMPINIIDQWEVSIRPCEFDNFARILGVAVKKTQTSWPEYRYIMHWLSTHYSSLIDLIDMSEERYATFRQGGSDRLVKPHLYPLLDEARRLINGSAPGCNIIRYLILRMHNQTLKLQYSRDSCEYLSGLRLNYKCIPFETMPFCTSLPGHNPRYWDLIECLNAANRKHELLARRIKSNVDTHGALYTKVADLEKFGDLGALIAAHNSRLYYTHTHRQLVLDIGHVFIRGYEDAIFSIIEKLKMLASSGIAGYTQAVKHWLKETTHVIDDLGKREAISALFRHSRVALIYGAAGTGKSTMVNHIAHYFNDKNKLFLAHTNPAIDNLKRKVTAQNTDFRTISSHVRRVSANEAYDILIMDECSTVSNADMLEVLNKTTFKLLVLVGDIFQIESIQFGNWFELAKAFIPITSVFELATPFRTKNKLLLNFWNKVRAIDDDLVENIAKNGYATVLDKTLFQTLGQNEIILCLNYDGLYGINNINRFLQSGNPGEAIVWRESTFKVGDPVLFNETDRFKPVIYNNLKGWIRSISRDCEHIQFDVEIDRPVSEFDVYGSDLEWVGGSIVRFSVYQKDTSDDDDDSINTTVPFQVAYAVSIHKSQGLEYDSVKIVITDANEDDITHSIFYTAVTRARERLRIYCSPETQHAVIKNFSRIQVAKDVALISKRRGITPIVT